MFWRKKGEEKKKKEVKKIEGALWGYMVSQHGVVVDILQNLRRVEHDTVVLPSGKPVTLIRIFDPAAANEKGIAIDDYDSLNDHPELVLYEGYYEKTRFGQATDIRIEKK